MNKRKNISIEEVTEILKYVFLFHIAGIYIIYLLKGDPIRETRNLVLVTFTGIFLKIFFYSFPEFRHIFLFNLESLKNKKIWPFIINFLYDCTLVISLKYFIQWDLVDEIMFFPLGAPIVISFVFFLFRLFKN